MRHNKIELWNENSLGKQSGDNLPSGEAWESIQLVP